MSPAARGSWKRLFLLTMTMLLEVRQVANDAADAVTQIGRDDERLGPAVQQAVLHRVRPKGGEQRPGNGAHLQYAKEGHIKLRDASHEQEHPVALLHSKAPQHVGEPVRQLLHLAEGVPLLLAARTLPVHGDPVSPGAIGMPVYGLVGQVQPAARKSIQLLPHLLPGEAFVQVPVLSYVRTHLDFLKAGFDDYRIIHDTPLYGRWGIGGNNYILTDS